MRLRHIPGPRAGTSLLELIVALSLTALVILAVTTLLANQQRLYRTLNEFLGVAPQQHDAAELLAADIRTMNTALTPTAIASDSAFNFATTIGASTLCATAPTGTTTLILPPHAPDPATTLTTWLSLPDQTDELLLYRNDVATPYWESHPIANITTTPPERCTAMLGVFPAEQVETGDAYEVTLGTPLPAALSPGAPIRFIRYGRYNVYRASDARWYVGYRHCTTTHVCENVQPLVGPFPKSPVPPVAFRFYTPAGTPLAPGSPLNALARIDIVVRHPANTFIDGPPAPADSTVTAIALRNHA
jgi:hypothetical protein